MKSLLFLTSMHVCSTLSRLCVFLAQQKTLSQYHSIKTKHYLKFTGRDMGKNVYGFLFSPHCNDDTKEKIK